jgi:hypothetical protein
MMRRIKMAGLVLLAFLSVISYAWATDYSAMSTTELSKLRGTMQSASQADRDTFHAEWISRVEQMTPAERQEYMGQGKNMRSGSGMDGASGSGIGGGMGSNSGGGMGGNSGGGMGGNSGGGMGGNSGGGTGGGSGSGGGKGK